MDGAAGETNRCLRTYNSLASEGFTRSLAILFKSLGVDPFFGSGAFWQSRGQGAGTRSHRSQTLRHNLTIFLRS
jgi:hypothetical protein